MNCLLCEDAERLGSGSSARLRCPFSGAYPTHDAELEGTCPRNLCLLTREGRAIAQTVLAVTLLLDPTGALMIRLLSRYGEWEGEGLRALMGSEPVVSAVRGIGPGEVDSPERWAERFGAWVGAGERAAVISHGAAT